VAHQKIIRNIAATLEALVGMGCGQMLRRGGFLGGLARVCSRADRILNRLSHWSNMYSAWMVAGYEALFHWSTENLEAY